MAVFAAPAIVAAIGAYGSSLQAEKDRKAFLETPEGKALGEESEAKKSLRNIERELEEKNRKIAELMRQLETEKKKHEDDLTKIKTDSKDFEEAEKLFGNVSTGTLRKAMNDLKGALEDPTDAALKLIDKTAGTTTQRGSLAALFFNLQRASGDKPLKRKAPLTGGADKPEEIATKADILAQEAPVVSAEKRDEAEAFFAKDDDKLEPLTVSAAQSTADPTGSAPETPVADTPATEPVVTPATEPVVTPATEPVVTPVAATLAAPQSLDMKGFLAMMGNILKEADAEMERSVAMIQTGGPKAVKDLKTRLAAEKLKAKDPKKGPVDASVLPALTSQMSEVETSLKELAKSKDNKSNTTADLKAAREKVEKSIAGQAVPETVPETAPATPETAPATPETAPATPETAPTTEPVSTPPVEENEVVSPPDTGDSSLVSTANEPALLPEETDKFEMINPMYTRKPTDMYTTVGKTPVTLPTKGEAQEAPVEKLKRLFTKKNRLGSRKGKATVVGRARKNTLRRRRGGKQSKNVRGSRRR